MMLIYIVFLWWLQIYHCSTRGVGVLLFMMGNQTTTSVLITSAQNIWPELDNNICGFS